MWKDRPGPVIRKLTVTRGTETSESSRTAMPKGPQSRMIVPWRFQEITPRAPWNFLQKREVGGKAEGDPGTAGVQPPAGRHVCLLLLLLLPFLFFPEGRGGHPTGHSKLIIFILALPHSLQELSSPARNYTHTLGSESLES